MFHFPSIYKVKSANVADRSIVKKYYVLKISENRNIIIIQNSFGEVWTQTD